MELEDTKTRHRKAHQNHSSKTLRRTRSGYEPSDAETDWQESRRHNRRHHPLRLDDSALVKDFAAKPSTTRISMNPLYMARTDSIKSVSSTSSHRDIVSMLTSALGVKEHENPENVSNVGLSRRKKTPRRGERFSGRPSSGHKSKSKPRSRASENKDQEDSYGREEQKGERIPTTLTQDKSKMPSVGELNEMMANIEINRSSIKADDIYESTDSVLPSDVFFSCDHRDLPKNGLRNSGSNVTKLSPRRLSAFESKTVGDTSHNSRRSMSSHSVSQTSMSSHSASQTTMSSSFSVSEQTSDKVSRTSSKMSDWSTRTTGSVKRFVENRRKSQTETWLSCVRGGRCKTSKSPVRRQHFDEAKYIEKANVVESLRPFWADMYQPRSLIGFTCHKRETQILKQLVLSDTVPHILFKGPSGSGKRPLAMGLLGEIFGEACWKMSHDLRYFQFQEKGPTEVVVPITSSAHHAELNVSKETNAKYALMGLVREISTQFAISPETSIVTFEPEYKVMVLYDVDKADENIQHMIKWVMDCYADACRLILCCEDDAPILESVKNRCKVIDVDPPVTHEIIEVLMQIARKENCELPMSFANKIATRSKQNLREAVMALEASKAHNYPFVDDQPIQFGWERLTEEIAAKILADPSHARLFMVRAKLQKLLMDFVHPKLILQKLVEQFLKRVEAGSRRQVYYWHAYYDKRLPTGINALPKLEEFVAKLMSIHRRSSKNSQFV